MSGHPIALLPNGIAHSQDIILIISIRRGTLRPVETLSKELPAAVNISAQFASPGAPTWRRAPASESANRLGRGLETRVVAISIGAKRNRENQPLRDSRANYPLAGNRRGGSRPIPVYRLGSRGWAGGESCCRIIVIPVARILQGAKYRRPVEISRAKVEENADDTDAYAPRDNGQLYGLRGCSAGVAPLN